MNQEVNQAVNHKMNKIILIIKRASNYTLIFAITVLVLFSALAISCTIPRSAIEENLKESLQFYKDRAGIYKIKNKRFYSYIHYYADSRKLDIIYCLDSDSPIESMLWSKYYQVTYMDSNRDFIDTVENSREPNTQYLRYWNGCMLILRPLLVFFNMEQIYMLNEILLAILVLVLLIMLFRKSKKLAFIFLLSLILVSSWYVALCIEYSVTFYIMIITSILAIMIDSKKSVKPKIDANTKLFILFFITGIITTFFEFLTTELLTVFVPLIIILAIRREEKREESLKNTLIFVIKICLLWFIGYSLMWLAKWVLASIILQINAFDYVKNNFSMRFNGIQGIENYEELYASAISRNIFSIPLLYLIETKFYKWEVKVILAAVFILILMYTNWKELKNKKTLLIFVLFSIVPYLRYIILANHSYRHPMFTFRIQIITIMALLYIIIDCFNYELLKGKLSYGFLKNIIKRKEK